MQNKTNTEKNNPFYIKELYKPLMHFAHSLCTDDFLSDFYNNLVAEFGSDNYPCIWDPEDPEGTLDFAPSTLGWFNALKKTFEIHPKYVKVFYTFYGMMEWHDSDIFDGEMEKYLISWYKKIN